MLQLALWMRGTLTGPLQLVMDDLEVVTMAPENKDTVANMTVHIKLTTSALLNKPLQGMAPTECLPSACLLACLLACLPAYLLLLAC